VSSLDLSSADHEGAREGEALFSVRGLRKAFGGLVAVEAFAIDLRPGEIVSTIGPNGAGKSTAFNLVSGLIPADAGTVSLKGQDLHRLPPHRRAEHGLARTFQNIRLFPGLTVLENVMAGRHVRTTAGMLSSILTLPKVQREERLTVEKSLEAMRYVNPVLVDRRHDTSSELPYGLQRELEIARALATEPLVLMLDEPAAGLNEKETAAIKQLLNRLRSSGLTIWLIEHDMTLVMDISDRIIVLDHGAMIAEGDPDAIRNDPAVIEAYLGTDEDL
jgi:branched-chain amino acid transport system ATP-binding protein